MLSKSSKNLYISISRCILSVTASIIFQFFSNSEISDNVEIIVIGCGQIVQHGWIHLLIISAPSHSLTPPILCQKLWISTKYLGSISKEWRTEQSNVATTLTIPPQPLGSIRQIFVSEGRGFLHKKVISDLIMTWEDLMGYTWETH